MVPRLPWTYAAFFWRADMRTTKGGMSVERVPSLAEVADKCLPAKLDKALESVVVKIEPSPAIAASQGKSAFFWHSSR